MSEMRSYAEMCYKKVLMENNTDNIVTTRRLSPN